MVRFVGLFALALAACGARTSLGTGGPAGPSANADASASADASADANAPGCAWTLAGAALRVSSDPVEVPGDVQLMDAVPTTGGALVVWRTPGGLQHAQTAVARLVAYDLVANGDQHVVLRAPSVGDLLDDLALGDGFGHVAITAFDGKACVLRPITLDGASNGGEVDVASRRCLETVATPSGFDLLLRGAQDLTSPELFVANVSPIGAPTTPPVRLFAESSPIAASRRATLGDGSFIVAAALTNGRIVARAFDHRGSALAPEQTIAVDPGIVDTIVAAAPVKGGALVAWVTFDGHGASVRTVEVDSKAKPGRATTIASSSVSITAIDLEPDATGGAVLAWTEYGTQSSSARVVGLSPSGFPRGAPVAVADPIPGARFAPGIQVVTQGDRGLVVFEASSETMLHRVWAAPLSCAR